MYYYYQPNYYQLPYGHFAYHPIQTLFVDPNFLYESVNQTVVQQENKPANQYNYPPTNPDLLTESAKESRKLMTEASKVLDKLATSKEFNKKLMDSAQRSDTKEVKRIIQSIGIISDVVIDYNPDRLRLEFKSKDSKLDCCHLLISLRWR